MALTLRNTKNIHVVPGTKVCQPCFNQLTNEHQPTVSNVSDTVEYQPVEEQACQSPPQLRN